MALGYGPRRSALDKVMVDAAVEAGAELRDGFTVEDIVFEGDRVSGIRGRSRRGSFSVTETERVTIAADGRNSRPARTVRAPEYEVVPPLTGWYFAYWSGVPGKALEVYVRQRKVIFAFPTNDGLFAVFVAWTRDELPAVRADIEGQFLAALDSAPDLAARVRAGHREEPFRGVIDVPNILRNPFGPGWALVGDAGSHKDLYLALGVCDAFRDAEFLVEALDEGLAGRSSLDAALATYERRRNEATFPDFQQNLSAARFEPLLADLARIRAAVRGNQEATNRFLMAIEGMIPQEAFFNPANLQHLLAPANGRSSHPVPPVPALTPFHRDRRYH